MIRDIVSIDESLCNGCGECVPACAEGAIRIVDGKARLVSDTLCDGLGACLGHCPQGAIKIERRAAAAFDEAEVALRVAAAKPCAAGPTPAENVHGSGNGKEVTGPTIKKPAGHVHTGCPSSRFARLDRSSHLGDTSVESPCQARGTSEASELTHWPVQLRLLPPIAPVLRNARLLVAADCVPVACAGFHSELLRDHAVVIACPKLDDPSDYVEKLAEMIRQNDLSEITVAHMEVPCCTGILHMVLQARQLADRDVPVNDVLISVHGEILARRHIPTESNVTGSSESACCPVTGVN
jgi:NAD-dependent dihydropyrimidine dehydrogenase PreA subunit